MVLAENRWTAAFEQTRAVTLRTPATIFHHPRRFIRILRLFCRRFEARARVKHEPPRISCSSLLFHHLRASSSKLLSRDFQRTANRKEISGPSRDEDDENHVIQVGGSHRLLRLPPSLLGLVREGGNPSIVLSDFPVSLSQPFPSAIRLLRDEAGRDIILLPARALPYG